MNFSHGILILALASTPLLGAANGPDPRDACAARLYAAGTHHVGAVMSRRAAGAALFGALAAGAYFGGPPIKKWLYPARRIRLNTSAGATPSELIAWTDRGARVGYIPIPAGPMAATNGRSRFDEYLGESKDRLRSDARVEGLFTVEEAVTLQIFESLIQLETGKELLGFFDIWAHFAGNTGELFPLKWGMADLFAKYHQHQSAAIATLSGDLKKEVPDVIRAAETLQPSAKDEKHQDDVKVDFTYRNVRASFRVLLFCWWESRKIAATAWEHQSVPQALAVLKEIESKGKSQHLVDGLTGALTNAQMSAAFKFVAQSMKEGRDSYLIVAPDSGPQIEAALKKSYPDAFAN